MTQVATVRIPTPLRRLTGNQAKVQVGGGTIGELIGALELAHPGIKDRLVDESGEIKRFVNIFVNGEEIRTLHGPATAVKDGDEVSIIPAMAGGAPAQACFCCSPMRARD
ncbi:MAG: MoaD/ThiS family protein [Chloroflexi bacterium]|nr:MoaD/ThiS family protein [Chloroflexota bacterium]